eukprot:1114615-Lingulodinium_polyedra.AAC.1
MGVVAAAGCTGGVEVLGVVRAVAAGCPSLHQTCAPVDLLSLLNVCALALSRLKAQVYGRVRSG